MPSIAANLPLLPQRRFVIEGERQKNPLKAPFENAYKHLRSIDGIDEFASLMGMSLPQLQQAIATLTVLGAATPFVAVGAKGAIDEALERFRSEFPELLKNLHEREDQILGLLEKSGAPPAEIETIRAMFAASKGWQSALPGAPSPDDVAAALARLAPAGDSADLGDGAPSAAEIVHHAAEYARERQVAASERIDRDFSAPAAAAMTGMTGGMIVSMADSVAGIVEAAAPAGSAVAQNAATASSILGTVAGATFLGPQLAMTAVGAAKLKTGLMRNEAFKQDRLALQAIRSDLDKRIYEAADEGIKRLSYYNKHHSISYGALTAVGQGCMAAGNIASLTGVASLVGILLTAAGAPLTVGAAVQKLVYEKKEEKYLGDGASDLAKTHAGTLETDALVREHGPSRAVAAQAGRYDEAQAQLVEAKLQSLIRRALDEEKPGGPLDQCGRHQNVARRVADLAGSRRTGLLPADVARMTELFRSDYPPSVFAGSAAEVRERLQARMERHALAGQLAGSAPLEQAAFEKTMRAVLKDKSIDLGEKLQLEGRGPHLLKKEHLAALRAAEPRVDDLYGKKRLDALVKQAKTDGKFLRQAAADGLVALGRARQLMTAVSDATVPRLPAAPAGVAAPAAAPSAPLPVEEAPQAGRSETAEHRAYIALAQRGIPLNDSAEAAAYVAHAQGGIDLRPFTSPR